MQTLTTASGLSFTILWCGISTIDLALRFAVQGMELSELFGIITNPNEIATLTHRFDENETIYTNYTQFSSINVNPIDGTAIVALRLA